MDYSTGYVTALANAAPLFVCLREQVQACTTVNRSVYEKRDPAKPPSITMGFCVLGGHISVFQGHLERAVMLHD
jgi:hypothetical protein